MAQHGKRIVALGEVLWDIFSDQKRPGGAPLNFAFHASQFGHEAWVVSRVGQDESGRRLLAAVRDLGLPVDHLQIDPVKPTGTVQVSVNLFGEPRFQIIEDVAWDALEATPEAHALVRSADVIWFDILAQRTKAAREAIRALLAGARGEPRDILIVCEFNLRQRFWTPEIIRESIEYCRVLRLNDDELKTIKGLFGLADLSDREFAVELMRSFALLLICVTHGPRGCTLHTPDAEVHSLGYLVDVKDTVGSGRAFTAAMVTKLLEGARFIDAANYANLAGAYVASRPGATPRFNRSTLEQFEKSLKGRY